VSSIYHIDKVKIKEQVLEYLQNLEEEVSFNFLCDYISTEVPETQKQSNFVLYQNVKGVLNTLQKENLIKINKIGKSIFIKFIQ
jgi:hypothetical protein